MRLAVPPSARAPLIGAGAFLLVAAGLLAAILAATRGVFSFTLDDPYIHLAMAEEIGRGGYGVNPGEPASASSSAIYPYLLAALLKLGAGQFGALALNLTAGAASTALLVRLGEASGLLDAVRRPLATAAAALAAVLLLNLAGLAFTGMEHGLHAALGLAALWALVRLERDGRPPPWLVPVLALAPLVRFEGAAILAAGAAALVLRDRWREAAVAVAAGAAGLALFAWSLHARGLPWLPSSVLAKAADGAHGPAAQFLENLRAPGAAVVEAAVALVLAAEALGGGLRRPRPAAVFAVLALGAQMAVGTFGVRYNGWLHRYEGWAIALSAGAALLAAGELLQRLPKAGRLPSAAVGTLLAAGLLLPYARTTLDAPFDARSIRLQQREMHRFAAEVLRAPVAVNDLGWVSWRNDSYVLDLWGLASEPARRARQAHRPPQWMDDLARAKGVRAVMIYDDWFGGRLPPAWVRLGELRARVPLSVRPRVAFYAVDARAVPAVRAAVDMWARGLPPEDLFVRAQPTPVREVTRDAPP